MIVRHLTFADALDIAQRMRPADRAEILATRWSDELAPVALDAANSPLAFSLGLERPICAIGGSPRHPGVWSAWMFATDELPRIGRAATLFACRDILPMMVAAGAHRIEARSAADHHVAHRWLEAVGGRREAVIPGYGRDRQDFILYAWRQE